MVEITDNGASYAVLLAVIVTASRELIEGDLGFSGDITPYRAAAKRGVISAAALLQQAAPAPALVPVATPLRVVSVIAARAVHATRPGASAGSTAFGVSEGLRWRRCRQRSPPRFVHRRARWQGCPPRSWRGQSVSRVGEARRGRRAAVAQVR